MATTRTPRVPGAAPAANPDAQAPTAAALDHLPNAIDIDAKKITGPVLTKQGWVCPDEEGRAPHPAKRV
jgi:hypothetical protein